MAIKERKQITGTTAQIDAYAGHEGQIVWDKDKKTFVGMSGTAGTNYPLASQTYVANEVQKNNTQLTEGLAGKEDKGVCLPLTGGKLDGALSLKYGGKLYQSKNTSYGYTVLTSKGDEGPNSCTIFLANHDSVDKGSMILRYLDGSGNPHDLYLQGESGEISWNRRDVETVSSFGSNFTRYSSGLQIFHERTTASTDGKTTTFSAPFSSEPIVVATHQGTLGLTNIVAMGSTTGVTLRTNLNQPVNAYVIAIGRWK